jgi:hypothetical protein
MVKIKYDKGDTKFDTIKVGVRYMSNVAPTLQTFPDELNGLTFTRREWSLPSDVTIDVPAGTTVYILLGDGPRASKSRDFMAQSQWQRIGDIKSVGPNGGTLYTYKRAFTEEARIKIPGGGVGGVIVAAKNLVLTTDN